MSLWVELVMYIKSQDTAPLLPQDPEALILLFSAVFTKTHLLASTLGIHWHPLRYIDVFDTVM